MGRICLFLRVSTSGQQLESQEDSLRRAAFADGYKEDDIIVIGKKESAIKLSEEEREGLNELKALIDKEKIECCYISEISRLSRVPSTLYSIREFLFLHKVQLKCLHPQFTLLTEDRSKYDATANIVFSLFGAMAEQEMLEKKERFARGKRQKAEENKYNGGRLPYGYRIDKENGNLIVVDEYEGSIVKQIYDLYEGGLSQPKIAKELNDTGRANIKISLINNILTNESYTGKKIKHKNASYERAYTPIITQEQFDRCRIIANSNNSNISKAKNIYYAEHLIKCEKCGAYWSATGCKASYHCSAAYKSASLWNYEYHKKERCNNKTSISINVVDSILWYVAIEQEARFRELDTKEALQTSIQESERIKNILINIEPRIKDNQGKMERLQEMYIDGLSKETYNRKKQVLLEERNNIRLEELKYKDELKHIEETIKELKDRQLSQSLSISDVMDIMNGKIDSIFGTYPMIHAENKRKIAQITDDAERYKIIHRQIKSIEIVPSIIKYPFNSGEKEVKCKRIIVHTFLPTEYGKELGETEGKYLFYSIPNGGFGPLILDMAPEMIDENTTQIYNCDDKTYEYCDEISNAIYLDRYRDNPKNKKRTAKSEMKIQNIGDKLSIKELMRKYGLSYAKVYDWLHNGKISSVMIDGVYYVSPNDADEIFGK